MNGLIPEKTFLVNTGEHAANLLLEAAEPEFDVGSAKLVMGPLAVKRLPPNKERTLSKNPGSMEVLPMSMGAAGLVAGTARASVFRPVPSALAISNAMALPIFAGDEACAETTAARESVAFRAAAPIFSSASAEDPGTSLVSSGTSVLKTLNTAEAIEFPAVSSKAKAAPPLRTLSITVLRALAIPLTAAAVDVFPTKPPTLPTKEVTLSLSVVT